MTDARLLLTTVASKEHAEKLAEALVEQRLAACVNVVGPIRSVYRWHGKVNREEEFLLMIKTTVHRSADLVTAFKALHPYELPERIEVTITGGSNDYLEWLRDAVSGD